MKTYRKFLVGMFAALCAFLFASTFTGCQQPPSQRVIAVQSLKAVGQSADAAVALSAQLLRDGRITPDQAKQVMDFYDTKFQPAYRLAVAAVQANLDSIASPDLTALATQLSALVSSFLPPPAASSPPVAGTH